MHGQSYDHCGSRRSMLGETIGQCLDRVAAAHPDDEFLVSIPQGIRLTYAEFVKRVDRSAKAFLKLGIRRGDRVALWSINNDEWVVAQFATARIGAVLVNVNPAYRTHELEYVLRKSQARCLILIESFKSSNYLEMFYEVCPEARDCQPGHLESWRFPHLKSVIFIGQEQHPGLLTQHGFDELGDEVDDADLHAVESTLDFDDPINIQYTSGTTGFPKGVLLSHNNILNNAAAVADVLDLTPADRVCVPVPFYHCFGMVVSNLGALARGATIVIPSPSFEPKATLRAVQQERCTVLHGVPTMFISMLETPGFDDFDLSTLRTGIMAGAPCPIELMRKVVDRMHMRDVLIAYGQTEASPVTTMTRVEDSLERRVSTVGRVLPHQELKVIDPESGRTLPYGETGELCFRGYQVMLGYDNMPDETHEAIDDSGWLHSGDLGTMDADGYVCITGRIKNMIIRGGENVFPREIEEFLFTLDPVADAQVLGIPDERFGEEILACIRLAPGHEAPSPHAFRELCRGQIAHFKIPRYWLVLDEYPMTVTGKVQKFKLRERAERELAAGTLPDARAAVPQEGLTVDG
jgi:fatty-acyl-CoA synthase